MGNTNNVVSTEKKTKYLGAVKATLSVDEGKKQILKYLSFTNLNEGYPHTEYMPLDFFEKINIEQLDIKYLTFCKITETATASYNCTCCYSGTAQQVDFEYQFIRKENPNTHKEEVINERVPITKTIDTVDRRPFSGTQEICYDSIIPAGNYLYNLCKQYTGEEKQSFVKSLQWFAKRLDEYFYDDNELDIAFPKTYEYEKIKETTEFESLENNNTAYGFWLKKYSEEFEKYSNNKLNYNLPCDWVENFSAFTKKSELSLESIELPVLIMKYTYGEKAYYAITVLNTLCDMEIETFSGNGICPSCAISGYPLDHNALLEISKEEKKAKEESIVAQNFLIAESKKNKRKINSIFIPCILFVFILNCWASSDGELGLWWLFIIGLFAWPLVYISCSANLKPLEKNSKKTIEEAKNTIYRKMDNGLQQAYEDYIEKNGL